MSWELEFEGTLFHLTTPIPLISEEGSRDLVKVEKNTPPPYIYVNI